MTQWRNASSQPKPLPRCRPSRLVQLQQLIEKRKSTFIGWICSVERYFVAKHLTQRILILQEHKRSWGASFLRLKWTKQNSKNPNIHWIDDWGKTGSFFSSCFKEIIGCWVADVVQSQKRNTVFRINPSRSGKHTHHSWGHFISSLQFVQNLAGHSWICV